MSNVVQLFAREQVEKPAAATTIARADFLAVLAELEPAIREFFKRLDPVDLVIDTIGNPEARKRQDQLRGFGTARNSNVTRGLRILVKWGSPPRWGNADRPPASDGPSH
jgi:hypothetical protein